MNFDLVQTRLKSALDLTENPKIVAFHHRKLSLIYAFDCARGSFILKLPKQSRQRLRDIREIEPKEKYQAKARIEWESLTRLHEQCRDEGCPVEFVEPVAFIEDLPGVVMRKAPGEDFYTGSLLRGRPNDVEFNRDVLRRIGAAFAFLHQRNRIDPRPGRPQNGGKDDKLGEWVAKLNRFRGGKPMPAADAMSGFTLTDVMVSPDGSISFLDPGRLEECLTYEDLARFIVELRKMRRAGGRALSRETLSLYEDAFLAGYRERGEEYESEAMGVFILGRLIEDLRKFRRKANGKPLRSFLSRTTGIRWLEERFFHNEIRRTVEEYSLQKL
jgi:hypothetical protein